jgi:hypothetical protein
LQRSTQRVAPVLKQQPSEVCRDYRFLDEQAMMHDPFTSVFLPRIGLRYFVSAVLEQTLD